MDKAKVGYKKVVLLINFHGEKVIRITRWLKSSIVVLVGRGYELPEIYVL